MIKEFFGKYRFLSNFYPALVKINDISFPTVEHAYQALKTKDLSIRNEIAKLSTPLEAKRFGAKVKLRDNWDSFKYNGMYHLVFQKFKNNKELRQLLMDTGDEQLMEGNCWHDTYWGFDLTTGEGENNLGKILMEVRKELK